MDLDIEKVDKLKVVELRTALGEAGLDTKGTKPILVARLKEYLESKNDAPEAEEEQPAEEAKEEEKEADQEMTETPKTEEPPKAEAKPAEVKPAEAKSAEVKAEAMETEAEKPKETAAEEAKPAADAKSAKPAEAGTGNEKRGQKRKREDEPYVVNEDEPEIPDDFICLDWFNSDLTMKINKENFSGAEPYHVAAWGYIFSSARATHGFTSGKIAFEVKWVKNMEVKLEDVENPHEIRVGFSSDDCSLQAGESPKSYCMNNFSKKAHNMVFEEFGTTFTTGDVLTCTADFDSANVSISYAKNGETMGEAFSIQKSTLEGKPLFPHISSRNVKFEVNFGKDKAGEARENWFAAPEGYQMASELVAKAQRGFARIAKRDECEMIMLMGLPGCGKTTWTDKYVAEHPEKRYNVVGTTRLEERMRVNGEPRRKIMGEKWNAMVPKLTKCVHSMLNIACQRRRNFIIDQTNVFVNAQKRKVRPFEGMTRKAVIIVPSDEDYKARKEAQTKAEIKDVPDNAVMEMKANFVLPEEGEESPFKEIIFTELQREEAAKVIAEYNKDAKEKGFGKKQEMQNKRRRGNFMRGGGMMRGRMFRGRPGMMGGRGGPRGMFPRGGFPPRGMMRGGPMRGGPMGGPRGMPFMPNRGGPMGGNRGGPMGNRGGPMGGNRGGPMGGNRGGPMGGNRGGPGGNNRGMMGGNRGGPRGGQGNRGGMQQKMGGMGGPAPWGNGPNPWQQQNQQRPQQGGGQWGNMWNQGQNNQGNPWGGNQRGGGNQGFNFGGNQGNFGGNQAGGYGNNQGYPGSQNWGGFR